MERVLESVDFAAIAYLNTEHLKINLNKSQIIWAPNGVGKSSIYKSLKGNIDKVSFAECSDYRASFAQEAKKKLCIGAQIQAIKSLRTQLEQEIESCAFPNSLKALGLGNVTDIKAAFPAYPKAKTDLACNLKTFRQDRAVKLADALQNADLSFFVANWRDLQNMSQLDKEVDALRSEMIAHAINSIEKWISEGETTCPVCGATHGDTIVELIQSRRAKAAQVREKVLKAYHSAHPEIDAISLHKQMNHLVSVASNPEIVDEQAVFSFALCGGDRDKASSIHASAEAYRKASDKIAELESYRDRFYENIVERKDELVSLFELKFEAKEENIIFDNEAKEITITLPREVKAYSTGEIDLLVMLVGLNAFIASDDDVIILDDPITSFDTANQYTVLFDLINIVSKEKKTVIILTHNSNCINIAESQYPGCFSYFGLDRWSDGLRIQPINMNNHNGTRYLCQQTLEDVALESLEAESLVKVKYLKAVKEREEETHLHKVFHYDRPNSVAEYQGETLENEFLVGLIESFDANTINKNSFVQKCIDKELTMIALRVWVEKQLYSYQHSEPYFDDIIEKPLGKRIEVIFSKDNSSSWHGPKAITRTYLMGKKVMLNQSSHSNAQSIPFEYALNLSVYDVERAVEDLKTHFIK
ncbi:MAG: hypothetical protein RR206_09425 [Bacteroidaceae bacterium]